MNFGLFKSILSQQTLNPSSFHLVHSKYCEIHVKFSTKFIICVNNLRCMKSGSSDHGAEVRGVLVYDETPCSICTCLPQCTLEGREVIIYSELFLLLLFLAMYKLQSLSFLNSAVCMERSKKKKSEGLGVLWEKTPMSI